MAAPVPGGQAVTSRWVKVLIVLLALGVVAAVTVTIIVARGVNRASNGLNSLTQKPGRPPGYHGPSYPGMLVNDHVASATAAPVNLLGETVTAGNLTRTASYFGPTLCSPVTVVNHMTTTIDVGAQEWKLQQPNGIVEGFALTGTLPFGQIAPDAKATGTVCFADSGLTGTFLLFWQPLLHPERAVWILHF